jgi:PAS domain S-box-containing protein
MARMIRVLHVEDSIDDVELIDRALRRGGFELRTARVETPDEMRKALSTEPWDIVLSDFTMPMFNATEAFEVLSASGLDVPFIIVSGTVGEETAVRAMHLGVNDYLLKGNLARLLPAVERALRDAEARRARRRAEHELSESEARYRILFDATPIPMWVFDRDTLRFLTVNEAALAHYGYAREEFAAMTLDDIRPAEDVPRMRAETAKAAPDVGTAWRHKKKDGTIIDVEVKTRDFDFDGLRGRLVAITDVTERNRASTLLRKTEEQLRQAQKMESVGRLAGGVAHDFNNLLSVILSYTSLALDELPKDSSMHEDLTEVRQAGVRATELTRQLLAFSRQQVLQPRIVSLADVVKGMEKMMRRLLGEDVELKVMKEPDCGKVLADPGQIEQVVMNLAVNARDAMPDGGKLTVEIRNEVLDEDYASTHLGVHAGPHVMLAVSDNGTGMDRETQARVFEPFFTTKEQGKGTGLGLSTVFGIVQQSGGHIWLYSERGQGTTFRIYFPRTDRPALAEANADRPAESANGSETILLVEDEPQVRAASARILRRKGYEVIEAANGDEAMLAWEQSSDRIDMLVTDVVMPRMSGRDLARRLEQMRPGLKVLYLSGYTSTAIVHHGVLDAGLHFLQKPVTPDVLSRKVREVLDVRAPATSAATPSGRHGPRMHDHVEHLFDELGELRVRFLAVKAEGRDVAACEAIVGRMRAAIDELQALGDAPTGDVWFGVRLQRARAWLTEE